MTKPMSDVEYVAQGAWCCPVCGSEDVTLSQDIEFGDDFLTEPVQCKACGRHWDNIYTLSAFEMRP